MEMDVRETTFAVVVHVTGCLGLTKDYLSLLVETVSGFTLESVSI